MIDPEQRQHLLYHGILISSEISFSFHGEKSLKEVEQTAQSYRNGGFNLDLSESEACVIIALFP